jgi:hypothetical protein
MTGSDLFFDISIFHRETPKNVIKEKREKKSVSDFLSILFVNFSTRFFCKPFMVVF